jgi:hypothetical protein
MRLLKLTFLNAFLIAYAPLVTDHFRSSSAAAETGPVSIQLNQLDAPLEILEYSARFTEDPTNREAGGIEHRLMCQNVGDQNIVAVEMTFLSFNLWNELFARSKHTFVRPLHADEEVELKWLVPLGESIDGSLFHSGVAYTSRLRFENGEIWSADLSEIALVLEKVAPQLSPSSL